MQKSIVKYCISWTLSENNNVVKYKTPTFYPWENLYSPKSCLNHTTGVNLRYTNRWHAHLCQRFFQKVKVRRGLPSHTSNKKNKELEIWLGTVSLLLICFVWRTLFHFLRHNKANLINKNKTFPMPNYPGSPLFTTLAQKNNHRYFQRTT